MASYFDLPPTEKAVTAASIEAVPEKEREKLNGMSLLSPAVTQILEDLGQEHSDSDSEERSVSEDGHSESQQSNSSRPDSAQTTSKSEKGASSPGKSEHSPTSKLVRPGRATERKSSGRSLKPKQPHMARFHSLRSMLFTSNVEDKMKKVSQEETRKQEAADKWKSQHDQRQMNRPKTPEKDAQGKDNFGSRIKTRIRRITSKDPPTLDTLKEDGGVHDFSGEGSTASSDAEDEREPRPYRDDDEESINHSDVEDLVRWVSRRDPPSDGEARVDRRSREPQEAKEDAGNESIGNSDVEDLVRWVSRRSEKPAKEEARNTGYSDASTESDSELEKARVSSEEEDADDLVRWISHRDGPNAGPVRKTRQQPAASNSSDHIGYDSDIPELGRWVTRHDGTSGESLAPSPGREFENPLEPERGRPRSRDRPSSRSEKNHITEDDIGDLVRWVSRHDSKEEGSLPPDPIQEKAELKAIQREEEAKQHAIGMSVDEGSLSHSDVKDLLEHVKTNNITAPAIQPKIEVSTLPVRPGEGESGVLRRENTSERNAKMPAAQEHLQKSRSQSQQIDDPDALTKGDDANGAGRRRSRDGSLGQEDVDELVKWVSQKH